MRVGVPLLCCWLTVGTGEAVATADPVFSDTGPDAPAYGAPGYPVGSGDPPWPQVNLVGAFSHYDQLFESHPIAKAASPSPLRRASRELALTYTHNGVAYSLDDYLERRPATGLLIAQGDEILFEHYRYGRTDRDRLLSQSMAKTITGMLTGIAIDEGKIRSVDEPVATYLPELSSAEYGKTPIRALLHMASGVAFREVYDGTDDIDRLGRALFGPGSPGPVKAVAMFDAREAPPDTRFHYASIETEVLGLVLASAARTTPAAYLSSRIWQPMGAEADASWVVDATGHEATFCCVSAVLRDWARFGLMLAHDGAWNGRQIVPRRWLIDATTLAPGEEFRAPRTATPFFGYGYQVWLFPGPRRQFALLGVHGQSIFVDPAARLVLVHTAAQVKPNRDPAAVALISLWNALVKQLAP